jgi:hypothetical protein
MQLMKSPKILSWLLLLTCLLGVQRIAAQEFTGRVLDPTGAAVPNAAIVVHNILTNEEIATQTNNSGVYTVPYLKSGEYRVSASAPGFESLIKDNITLEVGKTGVVNFTLKVGAASASVTVEANVALDLGKADRGEVVENARVTELPLNGRDPQMLAVLNAGVVWGNSQSYSQYQRPFDSTQTSMMINGGGAGNNVLLLDGVSNDAGNGNGVTGYVPPVDAVQEFKIITNPYDAQFGRGQGGVQDITLKSGTNQLHGDVYEFARRSWLDSDTWLNDNINSKTPGKATKGQHKLDQYGFELDGPVVLPKLYNGRDKTFFLLQFENWDEKVPNTLVTSVPDPNWIKGDFSNLTYWTGRAYAPITLYDPTSLHYDSASKSYVRNAFTSNNLKNRINSVSQKLLSYYPAPNLTPASGSNPFESNYTAYNPTTDTYRNALAKLDRNFGEKDRLSLRYGYWERWETRSDNGMPGEATSGAEPFGQHGHTFTTDWVHTFSPSLILDFRGSVIVRGNFWHNGPQDFNLASNLGWSGSNMGNHMPYMKPGDNFAYLGNQGANDDVENSLNLLPSVTWIKGNHTFHFGADIRDMQKAIKSSQYGPSFSIDRQWTQQQYNVSDSASGNSIASMLLGYATSGSNSYISQAYWTRHYFAPFIQDDWKVSRRLTVNLGIRYDINMPTTERHNRVDYAFDTTSTNPVDSLINHSLIPNGSALKGQVTFAGVNGNPRSYYATDWKNIQPRVGFAYAARENLVIRGGFGEMFRNPVPGGNTMGWSSTTAFTATQDNGMSPSSTLTNPFPDGIVAPTGSSTGGYTDLGQGPWFINPNYKTPGIWQYSFGIQQQFLKADTLEISYAGSHAFHQDSSDNINHWSSTYQAKCNIEMGGSYHVCDDPTNYATNPFKGISYFSGSDYYTAPTIRYGNLTRAFPQFGDVTEWQLNDNRTTYNSLQVTGIHRQGKDLTLHGTWTWSKMMDTGGYADTVYRIKSHTIDGNDYTHRITISGVYHFPVGRGRALLGNTNRLVDYALGGWELGSLYVYQTGSPWGMPSALEYKHNAYVKRRTEKTEYIRGVAGCVANTDLTTGALSAYNNNWTASNTCSQSDFVVRPSYGATENVVYTGIRLPSYHQFDSNLAKNFPVKNDLKLQLRFEAFNVLNHPLWQKGYESSASDAYFGTIKKASWGQSNLPRQVQLALKLMW